jgi:K+-transporting ATPase KdpF subunit
MNLPSAADSLGNPLTIIGAVLAVALLGYLVFALLFPEKLS